MREVDQGSDGEEGTQGGGGGAIPKRSKSRLAADEFSRKAGPRLESSIIDLRIEDILVLSAYSDEVISNNARAFKIKFRRLIARIYARINIKRATICLSIASESIGQDRPEAFERATAGLQ